MRTSERRFAEGTSVPASRTKYEIEAVLMDYGATHFGTLNSPEGARIVFRFKERNFAIPIPIPDRNDPEFRLTPGRQLERSDAEATRAWQQEVDRRWRCLLIVVKSAVEMCKMGVFKFEDVFLAWTALPDGRTVGEAVESQLAIAPASGQVIEGEVNS